MSGETNINKLLSNMKPELKPGEFVFCSVKNNNDLLNLNPICVFYEDEGITIILKKDEAEKNKIKFIYPCRLITLTIHSSLEAVGFLAAITKLLAQKNIPCNAVSAYYHDHLFIPIDKAKDTMDILTALNT